MLAVCFALTASACGDGGAVITDGTKTEGAADGKKAETGTTRLVSVENVEKYITIGEYKGLTLDNTVDAITDDDVQAQIDRGEKKIYLPMYPAYTGDYIRGSTPKDGSVWEERYKMFYHIDPDIDLVTVGPNTPQAKAVLAQEK